MYHEKRRNFVIKPSNLESTVENGIYIKNEEITGSVICEEKNEELSVIGLQINGEQAILFDKKLHDKIQKHLMLVLKKNKKSL